MISLQKFRHICSLSNVKLTPVIYSRFVSTTTIVQMPRISNFLVRNPSKNTSSHVPNQIYYIPLRNMSSSTDKPATNLSFKERLQDFIDFILSDPIVNFISCFVLITYLFIYGNEEAVKMELGGDITAKKPSKDT